MICLLRRQFLKQLDILKIIYKKSKVGTDALSEKGTGSCPFYEKRFSLAVFVPHSVAAKKRMDLLWVFAVSDLLRKQ